MTQLLDLNDYCLLEILDRLSPEQLFKVLRVNKRLNQLASDKINVKIKAITLAESDSEFNDCHHLKPIDRNEVLILWPMFRNNFMKNANKKYQFLSLLAKCSDVKSIDFNTCLLPVDVLVAVVRCCPQLECLKVSKRQISNSDELNKLEIQLADWDRLIFDQPLGRRLVHLVKRRFARENNNENDLVTESMLAEVAVKCINIRQFDLFIDLYPSPRLFSALNRLPIECHVKLDCKYLRDNFQDVVDELVIETLDLNLLGNSFNRLSNLAVEKFKDGSANGFGVDFVGLKRLELIFRYYYIHTFKTNQMIKFLMENDAKFSALEEFCFTINNNNLYDVAYTELFQMIMPTLKRLTIYWEWPYKNDFISSVSSVICLLENLEAVVINVIDYDIIHIAEGEDRFNCCFRNFNNFLNNVLREMSSLKLVTVKMRPVEVGEWSEKLAEEIKQLIRTNRNRFKVILAFKTYNYMILK